MSSTHQIEYKKLFKSISLLLIIVMVLSYSCGRSRDIRNKIASKQGNPDRKVVYLRFKRGTTNLTVNEYWYYDNKGNGAIIGFENQGYGFYLIDANFNPISKVQGPTELKYQFSKDPKEMRQWLMNEYGRPDKIISSPNDYFTYEKWEYDTNLEVNIQIEEYIYKTKYGEGYEKVN